MICASNNRYSLNKIYKMVITIEGNKEKFFSEHLSENEHSNWVSKVLL